MKIRVTISIIAKGTLFLIAYLTENIAVHKTEFSLLLQLHDIIKLFVIGITIAWGPQAKKRKKSQASPGNTTIGFLLLLTSADNHLGNLKDWSQFTTNRCPQRTM